MKIKTAPFLRLLSVLLPIILMILVSCKQDNPISVGDTNTGNLPNVRIDSIDPGDFRTYTQTQWGMPPRDNNAAAYLRDHWYLLDTVTIGCDSVGGKTLTFTSWQAVNSFLPQHGKPGPLDSSYVDPDFEHNALAGEVLALALNIAFDLADSSFGLSNTHLKDLCVTPGPIGGLITVEQVFIAANKILGGCFSPIPAQAINIVLARINGNFMDGRHVGPFLNYCSPK